MDNGCCIYGRKFLKDLIVDFYAKLDHVNLSRGTKQNDSFDSNFRKILRLLIIFLIEKLVYSKYPIWISICKQQDSLLFEAKVEENH